MNLITNKATLEFLVLTNIQEPLATSYHCQWLRKIAASFHNFYKSFVLRRRKAVNGAPVFKKKKGLCNGGRTNSQGIEWTLPDLAVPNIVRGRYRIDLHDGGCA